MRMNKRSSLPAAADADRAALRTKVGLLLAFLLGIGWAPPHVGHGVRPQEDWRSGLRLLRDEFEN